MARPLRRFARVDAQLRHDVEGYKVLVGSLFSSPGSMIAGGIAGIITPALCWSATGAEFFLNMTVTMSVLLVLRTLTVVAYRLEDHTQHGYAETRRWDALFFTGATLFSALMGVTSYTALVETDNPAAHVIVVAATIAFASGYVARNAGRPYFVLLQLVVFCVPLSAGLLSAENGYYHAIGYFAIFYIFNNIAITLSVYRNLRALGMVTKKSQRLAGALKNRNITLDAALNNMTYGLAMFDHQMCLALANDRFSELYGLPMNIGASQLSAHALCYRLVASGLVSAEQAETVQSACRDVVEQNVERQCELQTADGRFFALTLAPVGDGGVVVLTEDATERKATAAKIERMARFDELTGLANRFEFEMKLTASCDALAQSGHQFCVLYIDLDHFKQINDNLGHGTGDLVLVETAERLRHVAGVYDIIARFGGDEFLIIQQGADSQAGTVLAQRILDVMTGAFEVDSKSLFVSASVGVAHAPSHGVLLTDIMRHADIALYRAKDAGRSAYAVFTPDMEQQLRERHDLEIELRHAFENGDLDLHYQPIVDVKTGGVLSFEALMRWPHATRGMIAPAVFIPIAEETGLITRMGKWAIERACADAATWPQEVAVSVNLSPLQFRNRVALVRSVREALDASGLAPSRLTLELTESVLIEDQKSTLAAIRDLRKLGVKLSLDDFGSGYSSLAYLSTYPFSQVKIDRGFAQDMTTNINSRSIVEAVCQLGHKLGIQVVVEGVETKAQHRLIEQIGVDRGQGYLYGKAAPAKCIKSMFSKTAVA